METPNADGNATGSGSSASARHPFQCAVCDKVLGSEKTLEAHTQNHVKQFVCSDCGTSFGRQDQMSRHRYMAHGHNASQYICYIKGCTRSRQGMRSLDALVKHLANSHQGATTDDNRQAAADRGFQLPVESSSEEESDEDRDIAMTEDSDSSEAEPEQQEEPVAGHDHPLSREYYEYRIQTQDDKIAELLDRIDKQEARHAREIRDIHSFYESKLRAQDDDRDE